MLVRGEGAQVLCRRCGAVMVVNNCRTAAPELGIFGPNIYRRTDMKCLVVGLVVKTWFR